MLAYESLKSERSDQVDFRDICYWSHLFREREELKEVVQDNPGVVDHTPPKRSKPSADLQTSTCSSKRVVIG